MALHNFIKITKLKINRSIQKNNIVHKSFEIGIILKGIDGVLEVIGGILLIFLNPIRLNKLTAILTQHELSEDSRDIIANYMIKISSNFSISTQYFGVLYLISHGVVKFILVMLLRKKKLWAYPLTIFSLVLFIIYQIYRFTIDHSVGLLILTIFDLIMIALTFIEYKSMKNNFTL